MSETTDAVVLQKRCDKYGFKLKVALCNTALFLLHSFDFILCTSLWMWEHCGLCNFLDVSYVCFSVLFYDYVRSSLLLSGLRCSLIPLTLTVKIRGVIKTKEKPLSFLPILLLYETTNPNYALICWRFITAHNNMGLFEIHWIILLYSPVLEYTVWDILKLSKVFFFSM